MAKKTAMGKTQTLYQRTLAKKAQVTGIGIHSGKKVSMSLYPAPANFGICFKRTDLPHAPVLKANVKAVGTTESNTTLGVGENSIHTVEHLLAVFYGLGIDNVYCEINGPEVPIMDGSGASFIFLIKETGISTLEVAKNFIVILKPVRIEVGDKWAEFSPNLKLEIDSTVIFPHPLIKTQKYQFEFSCVNFVRQIGRARTFGMLKDVDMLRRKGLIKGGSLENAIVLDDFRVINRDGLRFKDEFVRHKILDIIGDMALLGHEVAGKITTYKSGHNLHNLLCRKLLDTPSAYQIVPATSLTEETAITFELPHLLALS